VKFLFCVYYRNIFWVFEESWWLMLKRAFEKSGSGFNGGVVALLVFFEGYNEDERK